MYAYSKTIPTHNGKIIKMAQNLNKSNANKQSYSNKYLNKWSYTLQQK